MLTVFLVLFYMAYSLFVLKYLKSCTVHIFYTSFFFFCFLICTVHLIFHSYIDASASVKYSSFLRNVEEIICGHE